MFVWRAMKEVLARVNSYRSGPPCRGGGLNNVVTQCSGFSALLSRDTRLTACASSNTNDKWAWRPTNQISAQVCRRDPREPVSSFISAMVGKASPDLSYSSACPVPRISRSRMGPTGMTTIAARGAFSATRARVDPGRKATPQIMLGWSKN